MKRLIIITVLSLTFAGASYGQCSTQAGFVCLPQETANKALTAITALVEAKDAIAKLMAAQGASDAAIASAMRVIEDYKQLDIINGMMIVKYKQMVELYEKTITLYAGLVEKLTKEINKPKTGWAKFLDIIKTVATLAAGVALGRAGL
jgi:hypothetical protein